MTTIEHALLGINGALAADLQRKHGWQIVAVSGFAAASPDWDGLPIVFSESLFIAGHRLWGHNVLACVLIGLVIGAIDYRYDVVTRCARFVKTILRLAMSAASLRLRSQFDSRGMRIWILVSILAALSQLPADLVVSGHASIGEWELYPFWPFSDLKWKYAMIRWGDPGPTIVFVIGMFAMVRWKSQLTLIARLTLLGVVMYIVVRG